MSGLKYRAAAPASAPACATMGPMKPLRHPAKVPRTTAATIARSTAFSAGSLAPGQLAAATRDDEALARVAMRLQADATSMPPT